MAALFLKEPFAAAFGKNNNFDDFFGFSGKGAELIWEFFFFIPGFFFFWLGVVLGLSRLLFGKTQG